MPAEDVGGYTPIIEGDVEHFVPSEETDAGHRMSLLCPCGPLMVRNVKGLLHRTLSPA